MEKKPQQYLTLVLLSFLGGICAYIALNLYAQPGVPIAIALAVIVLIGAIIVYRQHDQSDFLLALLTGGIAGAAYYIPYVRGYAIHVNGLIAILFGLSLFAVSHRLGFRIHPTVPDLAIKLATLLVASVAGMGMSVVTGLVWTGVMAFWYLVPAINRLAKRLFKPETTTEGGLA